jgi:hypothetical protein
VWKTGSGGRKSRALCCRQKEKHVRIAECRGDYLHANKRTKQGAYTVSKVKEGEQQQMLAEIFHFLMEEIFQSASVSVTLYLHTANILLK